MKKVISLISILIIPIISFCQMYKEFETNAKYMTNKSAIDWGDFDNDGDLDFLSIASDSICIYEFTNSDYSLYSYIFPVFSPRMAKWGDINNDSLLDFVLVTDDSLFIYKNTGSEFNKTSNRFSFGRYSSLSETNIEWGDYNNDGDLDILIHEYQGDSLYILDNEAEVFQYKHFGVFDKNYCSYATWGDYDNDGDLDIVAPILDDVTWDSIIVIWVYETNTYTLTPTGLGAMSGVAWGDFDNDNDLDLIFSSSGYNTMISENDGGVFLTPTLLMDDGLFFRSKIDVMDFDNDSDQDILMVPEWSNPSWVSDTLYIFENLGDFCFNKINVYDYPDIDYHFYIITKWGDFDNDNDNDILISRNMTTSTSPSYSSNMSYILENVGSYIIHPDICCVGDTSQIKFITLKEISQLKHSQWEPGGGIISYREADSLDVYWMKAGEKNISYIYSWDSIKFDTIEASITVIPSPQVNIGADITICKGATAEINSIVSGGITPYTYYWDNGSSKPNISVSPLTTSIYSLEVIGNNSCPGYDTITINVSEPEITDICMVTVDSLTQKNVVLWEKTPGQGTESYYVYKESSVGGVYNLLGEVGYDTAGAFIDETSSPNQHFDRYKIQTKDTCGNLSVMSGYHQSIYLSISQGLPGTYNLEWTSYVGFEYSTYKIYKGYTPDHFELIQELANTHSSYTDTATGIAYYLVAVEKSEPCVIDLKKVYNRFRSRISTHSNIEDTRKFLDVFNNSVLTNLQLFPVPFKDQLHVAFNLTKSSDVKIVLYNYLGIQIAEITDKNAMKGNYSKTINTDNYNMEDGIYFIKLEVDSNTIIYKIVRTN